MDTRTVVVTNGKTERSLGAEAWKLLASSKEKGSTRKGWTFVRYEEPKPKAAKKGAPVAAEPASTYIPPEVAAAATVAAAEATALAGQLVTAEEVLEAQGHLQAGTAQEAPAQAAAPAAPSARAVEAPAAPAPKQEAPSPAADAKVEATHTGPSDDLTTIPNVGPKTAAVLNKMGIHTFAHLRDADDAALANTLKANGLGVKEALIPHWKKAASDKVPMPA